MKLGISFYDLMEMEVLCKGNPRKMAEYTMAKRKYDETIAEFFNDEDDVRFIGAPVLSYVEELEERAKSGTERDKARAIIIRDRYEAREKKKVQHHVIRSTNQELRAKLANGEPITKKDMEDAYWLSRHNPTASNIALYTQLKEAHSNPETQAERKQQQKEDNVTPEMVQEAWTKAKETGRMEHQVAYAVLKRKLSERTDA